MKPGASDACVRGTGSGSAAAPLTQITSKELAEYNRGELAYMDHKARQATDYILDHPRWYVWMSARRALYLWTGYWSSDRAYLAEEPFDPANIPVATSLSVLGIAGLVVAWRRRIEAVRYAGLVVLYPLMYYFVHPEAYRMQPLDPFLAILGCHAIQVLRATLRGAWRRRANWRWPACLCSRSHALRADQFHYRRAGGVERDGVLWS